jgi:hypothetical protein
MINGKTIMKEVRIHEGVENGVVEEKVAEVGESIVVLS